MRTSLAILALVLPSLAAPALAAGGKKPGDKPADKSAPPMGKAAPACGAKILPLVEGNTWTYAKIDAGLIPDEKLKRLIPTQPRTVVITVKSVDAKKGPDTVVTLEEKITIDLSKDPKKELLDEHVVTTTITCNAKGKFEISPDSFFFAGEPGGYFNLELDKVERTRDTSWKLVGGTIGEAPWREDLTAHWTRKATAGSDAKLGSGTVEIEHSWTPAEPEVITTKIGMYHSQKIGVSVTGRVTLENPMSDASTMGMPDKWLNILWLADNVGMVQVQNRFAHLYQLTDATLK